jgi:citrate synthase
MSEVIFEITKDNLETGMRGYPVGFCTTSSVDPQKGLFYRGMALAKLVDRSPEQMIYLLCYGKEGTPDELTSFSTDLKDRGHLSQAVIRHIESLPRQGHPMKLFSAAILILGMLEGQGDYREDCMNLIAKLPHLVATVINYHAGWGETPPPNPSLSYMENFAQMIRAPDVDYDVLHEVFSLYNILHYDHGGGNLSAFTGKAVASGLEDMYGAIASAMNALSGPRHGKANQDCLEFVRDVEGQVGADASLEDVENLIRQRLANKELVYGFGHAVLRVEDPRATIFYDYLQRKFPDHSLSNIALKLREAGVKVLKENPKITNPYPNVDAVSGVVLSAAGFPYPEYFTVLFGLSRAVGISIQVVYERCEARDGKGTPIVRPKFIYKPS